QRAVESGIDLGDEDGAGRSAVALPQLDIVKAVAGAEEQGAVDVGQVAGGRAVHALIDVGDQGGPGGSAVGLPQFWAVRGIARGEKDGAIDVREAGGRAGDRLGE